MDPAKMEITRSRTPAYDRILVAASELFYRQGIRAVGVDAVAGEAGVTKKALYDKFGSRDELVAATVNTLGYPVSGPTPTRSGRPA